MLKITIISVGQMKESYFAQAIAEYEKRIGAYAEVRDINLKEENLGAARAGDVAAALAAEAKRILEVIPPRAYKVALCVEGKSLSSAQLADLIAAARDGVGELCFIIGSSHGLDPSVKKACDFRLSVSALTFPHRLMRVILTEAIYRGLSILAGTSYHK
ncbi:MAG: 23S rRNA (pseudouridine(1915)-N(3))-methyltransferase RlmH [Clostridia bacterium]|nr:23S rRNA (pseudouridine(1915)-N(3))-methyltransferase RlmH [Clostridia bacterium]